MSAKRLTFPLPHVRTFSPIWERVNDLNWWPEDFTRTRVRVASLIGTQASVLVKALLICDHGRPISVVRIAGVNYIRDGHHRVTRAVLHGQKTIRAYVLEYNGVRA